MTTASRDHGGQAEHLWRQPGPCCLPGSKKVMTMDQCPQAYWEPLWSSGRRYVNSPRPNPCCWPSILAPATVARRSISAAVTESWRVTSITSSAIGPPASTAPPAPWPSPHPKTLPLAPTPIWRCVVICADDLSHRLEPVYAAITCRLVDRWVDDKPSFLDRVRQLLAPGGRFWVVTEIEGRREDIDGPQGLGITAAEAAGPLSGPLTSTCSAFTLCGLEGRRGAVSRPSTRSEGGRRDR